MLSHCYSVMLKSWVLLHVARYKMPMSVLQAGIPSSALLPGKQHCTQHHYDPRRCLWAGEGKDCESVSLAQENCYRWDKYDCPLAANIFQVSLALKLLQHFRFIGACYLQVLCLYKEKQTVNTWSQWLLVIRARILLASGQKNEGNNPFNVACAELGGHFPIYGESDKWVLKVTVGSLTNFWAIFIVSKACLT